MAKNELYIELFHGSTDKEQDMDDWGSTGPVFGPLCYAHTTYGHEIKLGQDGDEYGVLQINEGMVYYNGIWYGDWSVFPASTFAESTDLQTRLICRLDCNSSTRKVQRSDSWSRHSLAQRN